MFQMRKKTIGLSLKSGNPNLTLPRLVKRWAVKTWTGKRLKYLLQFKFGQALLLNWRETWYRRDRFLQLQVSCEILTLQEILPVQMFLQKSFKFKTFNHSLQQHFGFGFYSLRCLFRCPLSSHWSTLFKNHFWHLPLCTEVDSLHSDLQALTIFWTNPWTSGRKW